MQKKLNIKLIYGTPYIHTATGLVKRGIKTLKDLVRTNLEDKCTVSEALSRSLTVMRTTVHSSIKETPFERHYKRKPRTEITNYSNKLINGYIRNSFSTTGNPPSVPIQQRRWRVRPADNEGTTKIEMRR